ncbi:conserved hypothetical protein [Burkholderia ambifaria AMMD]|uniref:Uncharacterized protein n=1 Tax=Burkholderia ambifaria (strain ATCC BAA-244 / DSM 16087 / CCUG 44356 / LMG 19182 / AMMD) TaxID=339670 RepID=Q0B276_BURCM|nr:conserved hypothetical protein [Burkholderia ambifaria AMMD]
MPCAVPPDARRRRRQCVTRRVRGVSVVAWTTLPHGDLRVRHASHSSAQSSRSVPDHAHGHDFISGVGMRICSFFGFLIRTEGRRIFNRRGHADIAVLGSAEELLAGLHDVHGHHDSLQGLQGEIPV